MKPPVIGVPCNRAEAAPSNGQVALVEQTAIQPIKGKEVTEADLQSPTITRVPQYRRDVFPKNILLSAGELADFCRLLNDTNERAKSIEFNSLDLSKFENAEQARFKVIWFTLKRGGPIVSWLGEQPVFINVILGIYGLLISLLFARFLFQYFRWLFPPMEYYKTSRVGPYTHRILAGAVCSAIILSAVYDLVKGTVLAIFGS